MIISIFKNLIIGILVAIFAWISVHFLAVFGLFVMVGYAIHWFLMPQKRFCLLCRTTDGGICKYHKSRHDTVALELNILIILAINVCSMGLIYGEYLVLNRLGFPPEAKTVSFIIPSQGQYRIGEIIPLKIEISGIKKPINSVQADIGFDPKVLAVIDISTDGSFANIFIQKEINNDGGWARLTGGLPNPGFFSDHGLFGTVYFQAKTSGLTTVKFLSSSLVLANDGKGSDVLTGFPSASYLVIPEKISQAEEQNQLKLFQSSPPPVLGAESDKGIAPGAQLKFFDDSKPKVLGTETTNNQPLDSGTGKNIFEMVFSVIGNLDSIIISSWQKIASML